jgi:3-phenylpropionate/cinnamic acid dioxygenase small subunit
MSAPTQAQIESFVQHEARLLDEQRWAEWDALFAEDGTYWVPASPNQPDPLNHVSHMYEDRLLRQVRIARFAQPNAYSLQPAPRCSHTVTGVTLDAYEAGRCRVTSRFLMLYYRLDKQTLFGGSVTHDLHWDGAGFRIAQKRVDLLNCDSMHESVQLYF